MECEALRGEASSGIALNEVTAGIAEEQFAIRLESRSATLDHRLAAPAPAPPAFVGSG
jgi:hypothetical protein